MNESIQQTIDLLGMKINNLQDYIESNVEENYDGMLPLMGTLKLYEDNINALFALNLLFTPSDSRSRLLISTIGIFQNGMANNSANAWKVDFFLQVLENLNTLSQMCSFILDQNSNGLIENIQQLTEFVKINEDSDLLAGQKMLVVFTPLFEEFLFAMHLTNIDVQCSHKLRLNTVIYFAELMDYVIIKLLTTDDEHCLDLLTAVHKTAHALPYDVFLFNLDSMLKRIKVMKSFDINLIDTLNGMDCHLSEQSHSMGKQLANSFTQFVLYGIWYEQLYETVLEEYFKSTDALLLNEHPDDLIVEATLLMSVSEKTIPATAASISPHRPTLVRCGSSSADANDDFSSEMDCETNTNTVIALSPISPEKPKTAEKRLQHVVDIVFERTIHYLSTQKDKLSSTMKDFSVPSNYPNSSSSFGSTTPAVPPTLFITMPSTSTEIAAAPNTPSRSKRTHESMHTEIDVQDSYFEEMFHAANEMARKKASTAEPPLLLQAGTATTTRDEISSALAVISTDIIVQKSNNTATTPGIVKRDIGYTHEELLSLTLHLMQSEPAFQSHDITTEDHSFTYFDTLSTWEYKAIRLMKFCSLIQKVLPAVRLTWKRKDEPVCLIVSELWQFEYINQYHEKLALPVECVEIFYEDKDEEDKPMDVHHRYKERIHLILQQSKEMTEEVVRAFLATLPAEDQVWQSKRQVYAEKYILYHVISEYMNLFPNTTYFHDVIQEKIILTYTLSASIPAVKLLFQEIYDRMIASIVQAFLEAEEDETGYDAMDGEFLEDGDEMLATQVEKEILSYVIPTWTKIVTKYIQLWHVPIGKHSNHFYATDYSTALTTISPDGGNLFSTTSTKSNKKSGTVLPENIVYINCLDYAETYTLTYHPRSCYSQQLLYSKGDDMHNYYQFSYDYSFYLQDYLFNPPKEYLSPAVLPEASEDTDTTEASSSSKPKKYVTRRERALERHKQRGKKGISTIHWTGIPIPSSSKKGQTAGAGSQEMNNLKKHQGGTKSVTFGGGVGGDTAADEKGYMHEGFGKMHRSGSMSSVISYSSTGSTKSMSYLLQVPPKPLQRYKLSLKTAINALQLQVLPTHYPNGHPYVHAKQYFFTGFRTTQYIMLPTVKDYLKTSSIADTSPVYMEGLHTCRHPMPTTTANTKAAGKGGGGLRSLNVIGYGHKVITTILSDAQLAHQDRLWNLQAGIGHAARSSSSSSSSTGGGGDATAPEEVYNVYYIATSSDEELGNDIELYLSTRVGKTSSQQPLLALYSYENNVKRLHSFFHSIISNAENGDGAQRLYLLIPANFIMKQAEQRILIEKAFLLDDKLQQEKELLRRKKGEDGSNLTDDMLTNMMKELVIDPTTLVVSSLSGISSTATSSEKKNIKKSDTTAAGGGGIRKLSEYDIEKLKRGEGRLEKLFFIDPPNQLINPSQMTALDVLDVMNATYSTLLASMGFGTK